MSEIKSIIHKKIFFILAAAAVCTVCSALLFTGSFGRPHSSEAAPAGSVALNLPYQNDDTEKVDEPLLAGEFNGIGLYLDGQLVGASDDKVLLSTVLEDTAEEVAKAVYDDVQSVAVINDITYVPGSYPAEVFEADADEMNKTISRNIRLAVTVAEVREETVEAGTRYVENDSMLKGTELVINNGADGKEELTYAVTYTDGKETDRSLLSTEVIQKAVDKVIEKGTFDSYSVQLSANSFIMPYHGTITSGYGGREYLFGTNYHGGIDLWNANCYGDTVVAAGNGVVVEAQSHGGFGYLVVIEHEDGVQTWYAHLSKFYVSVGQHVSQGQAIAAIGASGQVTGAHLHFEVRIPDSSGTPQRVDPRYYVSDYYRYA